MEAHSTCSGPEHSGCADQLLSDMATAKRLTLSMIFVQACHIAGGPKPGSPVRAGGQGGGSVH